MTVFVSIFFIILVKPLIAKLRIIQVKNDIKFNTLCDITLIQVKKGTTAIVVLC